MKTKPSDLKQNLFKAGIGLAAFGFAATGVDLVSTTLFPIFQGIAINVASQFGIELFVPYITKKWLSHPEQEVNDHIQRALLTAIYTSLAEIETDYMVREDVSSREAQSLHEFFAVLRDRSQMEYINTTRDELGQQEILNYVYDREATTQHLQDRLRIKLDWTSDEFYFTNRFIAYFPSRFAERVQFHLREELKGGDENQEKAKKAMDLLFFETLNASLNELREKQQVGQDELKKFLDDALATGTQTLQQVGFYGEIWISAIRQNRTQLDRIEQNQEQALEQLGYVRADMATKADVAALGSKVEQLYCQAVQPGLLLSEQFQALSRTVRETEQAFADSQTNLADAEASLMALETTIAQNPALVAALDAPVRQQRKDRDNASQEALTSSTRQQQAKQVLTTFLNDVAATQQAILNATSHRADKARELFETGKFAQAKEALNADELRRDQANLFQQRDTVKQQLQQLAQDFILKAELTVLIKESNWFAEAQQLYDEAIRTNEAYDTHFALAYFLAEHNQYLDAIIHYEKASLLTNNAVNKSILLNNLANLYRDIAHSIKAETAYSEALEIRRPLAQQNPVIYLPYVATTLNNLAVLYHKTSRLYEAETAYNEALSIRRQLAQQNPATYLDNVAATLNDLANLYQKTARLDEAEMAYDEALSIRRQLAQQNPSIHLPDVATLLNNLAVLYYDTTRLYEAETLYNEALRIRRQLARQNPAIYLPYVATTLHNVAILYRNTSRPNEAEMAYDEALGIYRQLSQPNPATYLPNVAGTLNNLAVLYFKTARLVKAEIAFGEALTIRLNLAQKNPNSFAVSFAETAVNMSRMYLECEPEPDQDKSIDFALIAIYWVSPYVEHLYQAHQLWQDAVNICTHWGIDWQAALQKWIDDRVGNQPENE